MSSSQKAKIALALALVLLSLGGIAAAFVIIRLHRSELLVRHTYDIEVAIGDLESTLTEVGRSRVTFVDLGTKESLESFRDATGKVVPALARIRRLTADNPQQQSLCDSLDSATDQRVAIYQRSVDLKTHNPSDTAQQSQFTFDLAKTALETSLVAQQMRRNEDGLLAQRNELSERLFDIISGVLSISFFLSAYMFWFHYRLLSAELHERRSAENQLRKLSLQLMRVQDEEHRRFARELHDGLGQTISAIKMMAHSSSDAKDTPQLKELDALLDDAISQTRTISHLFHPPFLDEIGFSSAATWLIEGYGQRMGVRVSAKIPQLETRLPRSLELTLYRVLQEALNNIQRHSKSARADVTLKVDPIYVTLVVKDYGLGISREKLDDSKPSSTRAGVGLTGMRERIREQGGELEIRSDGSGTEIIVKIPISPHMESPDPVNTDSVR